MWKDYLEEININRNKEEEEENGRSKMEEYEHLD